MGKAFPFPSPRIISRRLTGRRVFPALFVEFCRRHVDIIFLAFSVVPHRNDEIFPEWAENAVETKDFRTDYVNKFCEQIVPFRVVLA